jgi:hypothetical protein
MSELMTRMSPDEFVGLVAVLGAYLCGLAGIIMGIAYAIHRANLTHALKRDMLERGMTPDEMRLVLEAGTKRSEQPCKGPVEAEV